ncbi:MAG: ABC transporter substrate-binding protein, partial [Methylococcaceae bacterium]|nr:ABC transporter substrate-binding protein [Methylococcaceae bacterium]
MKNSKFGGVLLLAILCCPALSAEPLTASETRGKQLYSTGASSSGKAISARVGLESTELSGTQLPCVSCHGEDGRGRPEGGIVPTNITFEYLTLAYGHNHDNGRKHAAFTSDTIVKAISDGIDPAGNQLDVAMPRYTLSNDDSADLIAYLKRLANEVDAGLTETTIRVGTLLPLHGALADTGQAMKDILSAYFNEINAHGGIYNRKIQLEVAEFTGDSESTLKNVRRLFESEPVFAMISPFSGNLEQDILLLSEQQGIPQIGAYTLFPEEDVTRSQFAFYLLAGLNNESRAMVDYAVEVLQLKNSAAMVISPENSHLQKVAKTIEKHSQTRGLGSVTQFTYPANSFQPLAITAEFNKHTPTVIFFFGSRDELDILLKTANALKPTPYIFISSALTGATVVNKEFADKIFLSS